MRRPRLYKWTVQDNIKGLLFFAQALEELLFHHTVDSFKAPALNTHLNVYELHYLSVELWRGRIKPGTLNPVIEELESKIKVDPVLEDNLNVLYLPYIETIKRYLKKPDDLLATVSSLLANLDNCYWPNLKQKIIEYIDVTEEKQKILKLAINLTSEVELRGYSRFFLYFMTINFFFNEQKPPNSIDNPQQVEDFLNNFKGEDFVWEIVFRANNEFTKFIPHSELFKFRIAEELPEDFNIGSFQQSFFTQNDKYPLFIIFQEIHAKDRYIARSAAKAQLDFFADICRFYDHKSEPQSQENCVVRRTTQQGFMPVKPPPPPMKRGFATRLTSEDDLVNTLNILKGAHFDDSSRNILIKALNYHRNAIESSAPESQLVSLWSAFEGFLPAPGEQDGKSRIEQYLSNILPPLTLSYTEKIFRYTSDSLYHAGSEVREHVDSCPIGNNFIEKTIVLLVSTEIEEDRSNLYSLLENNPLLLNRCFWCFDNFKSNKNIRKLLNKHRNRVSWHIQRIYTTRNQIVHSAEHLPYLSTLVENLHTYFDMLINSVVSTGVKSEATISISMVLKQLEVHEKGYLKQLEGEKVYCDNENFIDTLFGSDNPLRPSFDD